MRRFLTVAALALVAAFGFSAEEARAERYVQIIEGYRCEVTFEGSLGKYVCRNPSAPFRDYYVMLFDFDYNQSRVFMDLLRPNGTYENGNMSFAEFQRRYGR